MSSLLENALVTIKVFAVAAFTMAMSMVGGQDAVKKSGEKVLGEATNTVFKSTVSAVVGQIKKLPAEQQKQIKQEICK